VATCDRLLGDPDRGREQLDARTVLVVDEAGMVGSRKLARLLEQGQQAQAKVVLVGDDPQLAAIVLGELATGGAATGWVGPRTGSASSEAGAPAASVS
jgi:AAA domain